MLSNDRTAQILMDAIATYMVAQAFDVRYVLHNEKFVQLEDGDLLKSYQKIEGSDKSLTDPSQIAAHVADILREVKLRLTTICEAIATGIFTLPDEFRTSYTKLMFGGKTTHKIFNIKLRDKIGKLVMDFTFPYLLTDDIIEKLDLNKHLQNVKDMINNIVEGGQDGETSK